MRTEQDSGWQADGVETVIVRLEKSTHELRLGFYDRLGTALNLYLDESEVSQFFEELGEVVRSSLQWD